jgi:hypothetical protein
MTLTILRETHPILYEVIDIQDSYFQKTMNHWKLFMVIVSLRRLPT